MRKLVVIVAILASYSPASVFAQATSGGQAQQYGAEVRANPYNSMNVGDQYSQQRQLNNLSDQKRADAAASKMGPARPAAAKELTAGAEVNDKTGALIARIEQVDTDGVILSSNTGKLKIPANAFGHNKAGLLLDMTKAEFDAIVSKANAG